jgi:hypothetical protein
MDKGVTLTPDILELLDRSPMSSRKPEDRMYTKKYTDSTQFLLLLVIVAALLLATFPLLFQQTNRIFASSNSRRITPGLHPTPTPDSSLLFYIHDGE